MLPTGARSEVAAPAPRRRDLMRLGLRLLAAGFGGGPAAAALAQANSTAPGGPPADGLTFTHISICVRDLERSVRFYCDALAFEKLSDPRAPSPGLGKLVGIEGDVRFWLQHIKRQEVRLQLMKFDSPLPIGDGRARPMNALGVTHFSVRSSDLEATLVAVRRAGGTVLEESRTVLPTSVVVFCLDPDGNRIELSSALTPRKS